jgi:hypothetical protein
MSRWRDAWRRATALPTAAVARVREATGGPRRRWRRVETPPGGMPGLPYVLLDGATCPIPEFMAGLEFEAAAEEPALVPAITWRRSGYWAPRVPSRYDWIPIGTPHPLGPDPEHNPRRR